MPLRSVVLLASRLCCWALVQEADAAATKMAIMEMTISNSIKVKPKALRYFVFSILYFVFLIPDTRYQIPDTFRVGINLIVDCYRPIVNCIMGWLGVWRSLPR